MDKVDMQIKLLMLGNSGVGKTSLVLKYHDGKFSTTFITTIGIDFKIKKEMIDNRLIKIQIWDTAGQERFKSITESYLRGANGIVLVYDISDRESFNSVESWVDSVKNKCDKSVDMILLANKSDTLKREVSFQDGQELADKLHMPFFEVSAKTGINVDTAFKTITKNVVTRVDGIINARTPIKAQKNTRPRRCSLL